MAEMFLDEWERLKAVENVFWGPEAPYRPALDRRGFAPLEEYASEQDTGERAYPVNRSLADPFVISGGVTRSMRRRTKATTRSVKCCSKRQA